MNVQLAPRVLTGIAALIISLGTICHYFPEFIPRQVDLIQYWSGATLYFNGGDPYQQDQMSFTQQQYALPEGTIRLWNPPTIFPLIALFAATDYQHLRLYWFIVNVSSIVVIIFLMLRHYQCQAFGRFPRLALYLSLLIFYPFFEMLNWGQIGIFLLIGIVGWWLMFRQYGFQSQSAGMFLALTTIKPHLLVLLYLVLCIGTIVSRQTRFMVGFAVGVLVLSGLSYLGRFDIWTLYSEAMATPPIYWRNPNLGTVLQALTGVNSILVRHLPLLLAMFAIVAAAIGSSNKNFWTRSDMLIMFAPISVLLAPYGWIYDHVILIPWLFEMSFQVNKKRVPVVGLMISTLLPFSIILILPDIYGQERGIALLVIYSALALYYIWRYLEPISQGEGQES